MNIGKISSFYAILGLHCVFRNLTPCINEKALYMDMQGTHVSSVVVPVVLLVMWGIVLVYCIISMTLPTERGEDINLEKKVNNISKWRKKGQHC